PYPTEPAGYGRPSRAARSERADAGREQPRTGGDQPRRETRGAGPEQGDEPVRPLRLAPEHGEEEARGHEDRGDGHAEPRDEVEREREPHRVDDAEDRDAQHEQDRGVSVPRAEERHLQGVRRSESPHDTREEVAARLD